MNTVPSGQLPVRMKCAYEVGLTKACVNRGLSEVAACVPRSPSYVIPRPAPMNGHDR